MSDMSGVSKGVSENSGHSLKINDLLNEAEKSLNKFQNWIAAVHDDPTIGQRELDEMTRSLQRVRDQLIQNMNDAKNDKETLSIDMRVHESVKQLLDQVLKGDDASDKIAAYQTIILGVLDTVDSSMLDLARYVKEYGRESRRVTGRSSSDQL